MLINDEKFLLIFHEMRSKPTAILSSNSLSRFILFMKFITASCPEHSYRPFDPVGVFKLAFNFALVFLHSYTPSDSNAVRRIVEIKFQKLNRY